MRITDIDKSHQYVTRNGTRVRILDIPRAIDADVQIVQVQDLDPVSGTAIRSAHWIEPWEIHEKWDAATDSLHIPAR